MSHYKFVNPKEATIYKILSDAHIAPSATFDYAGGKVLITTPMFFDKHQGRIGHDMKTILLDKVEKMHDMGIFHGDLHERNVVLSRDEPYIIDFGMSEFIKDMNTELIDNWYKPKGKTVQSYLDYEIHCVESYFV